MLAAEASASAVNLTAVIVAAIGAFGGVLSFFQASAVRREQRKMEQRKVDAEAYERARKFDQEVVTGLRAEVERLEGRLRDEVARLQAEQERNAELEAQLGELAELQDEISALREALEEEKGISDGLRRQVRELEGRMSRFRERLAELGIDGGFDGEEESEGFAY